MKLKPGILIILLICMFVPSFSQVEQQRNPDNAVVKNPDTAEQALNDELIDKGILYRYEMSGGILVHSNGFGANFRKGKHLTGYKKRMWEIEVVNMKHPKEYKAYNPYYESAKGYIFGKQYSFLIIRPGIGAQKVITTKANRIGVEVRYLYLGGVSLGFLKPVYLEIGYPRGSSYEYFQTEKYDPLNHREDNIFGRAPFIKGINETKLVPGIFGKFGFSFEYGAIDDKIRALETGITIDLFYNWREKDGSVPIMAKVGSQDNYNPNKQYFISLYINIHFGNKW